MVSVLVNLKERVGDRFKVFTEDSWSHETEGMEGARPWSYELRGKRGVVYPAGGDDLIAYADKPGAIRAMDGMGLTCRQRGDGEASYRFPAHRLEEVATALLLKKKRTLSLEQREKLRNAGGRHRFKPTDTGLNAENGGSFGPISPDLENRV